CGLRGGLAPFALDVVFGDGGEAGLDFGGDLAAVEGGDGHVDAVLADGGGLLGDQGLHGAFAQGFDLVRAGVEPDDLHGGGFTGLAHAGGGALGGEQVRGEHADDVGVFLQRGADQVRRGGRVVLGVLHRQVGELGVGLGGLFEALGALVGGGDARVHRHHHDLPAVRVQRLDGLERGLAAADVVRRDRRGGIGGVLGGGVHQDPLGAGRGGVLQRLLHRGHVGRRDQDRVRLGGLDRVQDGPVQGRDERRGRLGLGGHAEL